jgi:hypothetical protein
MDPYQTITYFATKQIHFYLPRPIGGPLPGPSSARKIHLQRLCDILHLSIQRGDLHLSRSAFGLLARCEDVEWAAIWNLGLVILAAADPPSPGVLGTPIHIEVPGLGLEKLRIWFCYSLLVGLVIQFS